MKRSGFTVREFKAKAEGVAVFGPADAEWRTALAEARTWEQIARALPRQHPLAATAQGREEEREG